MRHALGLRTVVHGMRQRIARGEWPAESRLPTRDELALLFGTSPSTVQVAIRGLVAEGSVVTRKRAGAFVASEPPERSRFALVMSGHGPQAARGSSFFLDKLIRAAERVATLHPGWRMEAWAAGDPQLEALIASGALAGILYFGVPEQIPAVADAGIPLALFRLPEQPSHGAVSIAIDNRALFAISVRCHLARSRTRIAVLETGGLLAAAAKPLDRGVQQLVAEVRSAGGTCQPPWIQCVHPLHPLAVHQTALLLLDVPASARPDALILMDDHLLPPVLAAISSLGLEVPRDLSVSVLAFQDPHQRPDGCIRLGYDVDELVLEVLRRLSLRRQGRTAPRELRMPLTEMSA